ncbi:MAG TPA: hypothetical protein VLD84_01670, partial [Nitrososphaeraceae archaeon]|nr:hypothetical protein [Nitrososphaeraceae archaeon]
IHIPNSYDHYLFVLKRICGFSGGVYNLGKRQTGSSIYFDSSSQLNYCYFFYDYGGNLGVLYTFSMRQNSN